MGILNLFRKKEDPAIVIAREYEKGYENFLDQSMKFAERSFEAATKIDQDLLWESSGENYNDDVFRYGNKVLRACRHLAKNNDLIRGIIKTLCVNVVGPEGFRLTCEFKRNGKILKAENEDIESHWKIWCRRKFCDVSGKKSFPEICKTVFKTVVRDGEALVWLSEDKSRYGLRLMMVPVDQLDRDLNVNENGRMIIMGIEVDSSLRPVNYYLKSLNNTVGVHKFGKSYRIVPANEMIHVFRSEHPEAVRDVSWLVSSIVRISKVNAMDSAVLKATMLSAAKMAFIIKTDKESSGAGSLAKARRKKIPKGEGVMPELSGVKDVIPFDPAAPKDTYMPFRKGMLRDIATGTGTSYNEIANDLEGVTYAALRQRKNDDESNYQDIQSWFVDAFVDDVYERWMYRSALKNKFSYHDINNDPEYFSCSKFRGRRWKPIDPLKAVKAQAVEIGMYLKSRRKTAHENGYEYKDEIHQIQSEAEELKGVSEIITKILEEPDEKEEGK